MSEPSPGAALESVIPLSAMPFCNGISSEHKKMYAAPPSCPILYLYSPTAVAAATVPKNESEHWKLRGPYFRGNVSNSQSFKLNNEIRGTL